MVTPLVYGHRGASLAAPENTLEAFRLAGELGADGVELDVRRSADGELVLVHDAVLPDGRAVHETASHELPAAVPTLEDALDVCVGLIVNIEIKNISFEPGFDPSCQVADLVVALLAERGGRDAVVVSSFHLRTIDRVRALDPDVPTGLLTLVDPLPADGAVVAAERGHTTLHPHHATIDAALVDAAHQRGLAVIAWTVDDPDRIGALAAMGVDGLITNAPDVARGIVGPAASRR